MFEVSSRSSCWIKNVTWIYKNTFPVIFFVFFFLTEKKIRIIVPVIISWSNPFLNSFSSKAISVWFFFWSSSMVYFSIRIQVFRFLCISKIVLSRFEYGQQNISKLSLSNNREWKIKPQNGGDQGIESCMVRSVTDRKCHQHFQMEEVAQWVITWSRYSRTEGRQ